MTTVAISGEASSGLGYLVMSETWAFVTIAHESLLTGERLQAGDGHGVEEPPLQSPPGWRCAPGGERCLIPSPLNIPGLRRLSQVQNKRKLMI